MREVTLDGEEGEGIGENARKYVKKALVSKQTLGHFNNVVVKNNPNILKYERQ